MITETNRLWLCCFGVLGLVTVAAKPCAANETEWRDLFDGKTLAGWESANFGGEGEVTIQDGVIEMDFGGPMTGITYLKELPKSGYEIRFEAKRVDGIDFFCATTFPVGMSHCTFVVGGWAGSVVGLSNIDDLDASENKTTRFMTFRRHRWYRIRIRVTEQKIETWIDDKQVVDQPLEGRKISTRPEVDLSKPLGIAAFETRAALRGIQLRLLK